MDGGTRNKIIKRIFVFIILVAFGIVPISLSYDDGVGVHIDIIEPEGELHFNEPVRLKCFVDGLDDPYTIRWQCLKVGFEDDNFIEQWEDIDCDEDEYEFILTPENINYYYRVLVLCINKEFTLDGTVASTDS